MIGEAHRYVLGVVCTTCGAKRGEHCVTRERGFGAWFSVRIALALGARRTMPHVARCRRAVDRAVRSIERGLDRMGASRVERS